MSALTRITVVLADDDERYTFDGYTNGRRWNGWECPWFSIGIAEQMFARIECRTRRASAEEAPHGGLWVSERDDGPADAPYLLKCEPTATVDGDRPLMDCGGWLVFQNADRKQRDEAACLDCARVAKADGDILPPACVAHGGRP